MSENSNRPAFPVGSVNQGLTKREYFAGLAMQGMIANKAHPGHWSPQEDSGYCVSLADALLAELAKESP